MINSFEVGAVFRIVDNASPALAKIFTEATRVDRLINSIQRNLASLGKIPGIATLNTQLTGTTTRLNALAAASTRVGASTAGALGPLNAQLIAATANANALTTAMAATAAVGRGLRVPNIPTGGGRGGGGGGHAGGGAAAVGLSGMSTGIPMAVGHASAHLRGAGTGPLIATMVGGWGLKKTMQAGIEPAHQEAMLRLLGLGDAEISQVMDQAWKTTRAVPSSGIASNIKTIGEMYSIVGLKGALSLSPGMATLDRVMAASGKGKDEGSAYVLTRAAELMGRLTDPNTHEVDLKAFESFLDTMSRGVVATHGKITPAEMLNYAKQAGPASGALTSEGMMTTFAIIQAMGGNRAGTAAAALSRQFAGGVMSQRVSGELTRIGVAQPGDFEVRRGGQVVAKTDAMKGFVDKLQKDPLAAITDVLIPALESKGFKSNEDISREIYKIIGTGPAQREVYELIRGREQIHQERDRMTKALPAGQSLQTLTDKDPAQVLNNFSTAFHNLLAAIGSPMMQAAIPALNAMTSVMGWLAEKARTHPTASNVAGSTITGLGAGAAIGFGIGWLGGPVGAGAGALIGGALGFGYGLLSSPGGGGAAPPAWPAVAPNKNAALWGNDPNQAAFGAQAGQRHISVTVKAETDRPDALADAVATRLSSMLSGASVHNLGQGEGAGSSAFNSGGGLP